MWCRLASAHRRSKGCALNIYFVHTKDALILKCFGRSIASRFHLKNCGSIAPKRVANSLSKRTPFFFLPSFLDIFKWASVCFLFMKPLMLPLPLNTHVFFFPLLSNDTRPLYVQYRTSTASQKYIGLRIRVRHRGLYVSMCLVE